MRKGKLGVVLCLYPIVGFACVILNQPLLCAAVFALALIAERTPGQAGKPCSLCPFRRHCYPAESAHLCHPSLPRRLLQLGSAPLFLRGFGRPLRPGVPAGHCGQRVGHHPGDERPGSRPALLSDLAYWAFGLRKPRPVPGQYPPPPLPAVPSLSPPPYQQGPAGQPPYPPYTPKAPCAAPAWGPLPRPANHPRSKGSFFQLNRSPSACERVEGFFLPFWQF